MSDYRRIVFLGLLVILIVAGCASPAQPATPTSQPAAAVAQSGGAQPTAVAAQNVALKISGKVAKEMAWSEDQVRAMPTAEAKSANQKGETQTYSGVALNALLTQAGVKDGATTLVMAGEGGQTAEVAWSAIQACRDCIVSFRSRSGFSLVMPGFPDSAQIKGLTAITVK